MSHTEIAMRLDSARQTTLSASIFLTGSEAEAFGYQVAEEMTRVRPLGFFSIGFLSPVRDL